MKKYNYKYAQICAVIISAALTKFESNKRDMIDKRKIIISVMAVLLLIQIFGINKEAPAVEAEKDFMHVMNPPAEVAILIKTACYDCHSYKTKYPWYTNVAPLSWWIGDHIEEGREHLNFSIWAEYDEKKALHKLEEFYEEVEEGEMPLASYTLMHSEASLSPEEVELMVGWVKSIPGVEEE
ncbi:heme-binding domain-containing protein [Reichenbachiella ulvae]|uniref:Heme-binding domain-containing protein n=1 Tax=Reichenbachiella ulvae TaxID=2980104 RepID=A0ABT3CRK0_9BACT|nr:heme-binding domain-containing protein [Reichenbachiella ulvae]MCV9386115.1 heme-binding domain-containing protein [Reichenbachiella ulvae]